MKPRFLTQARSLLAITLILTQVVLASGAGAQTLPPQDPSQFDMTGVIQAAVLDPTCTSTDVLCGGTITVNNQVVIVPKNTILQMPAAALTWQEVFALAPAPYGIPGNPGVTVAVPTSGLARTDLPKPLGTYEVHVVGNRVGDQYIAGLLFLAQHSLQSSQGFINFIDYSTGEFRVGGTIGSATTGQRVKINDPAGNFGRAWTPDPRFTIDEGNPTVRSATGYPMCIPRGPAAGGDVLCPQANRPLDTTSPSGFAMTINMPPVASVVAGGLDPRLMAPFEVGDYVTYSGILVSDPTTTPASTYIAAFQVIGNVGLYTAHGDPLAYVATDVFILGAGGTSTAGLAEATIRTRFEGFTTDPSRNILLFGIDVDACTGAATARPWGAIGVDPGAPTGAVLGRWRFRPPCTATTPTDKACTPPPAGTFLPPTREMRASIETALGSGVAAQPFLVNGVALPGSNQYQAPIFEFLFPENGNAGTPIVPNNFESFPFLAQGSGPLEGTGPIVGQINPWPTGFTAQPTPVSCALAGGTTANAGPNQIVGSGALVTLQGSGTDALGLPLTFAWTQTSGTPVVLNGANTANPTFTAPFIAFGQPQAVLIFQLVVTNSAGVSSSPASVSVTVNPVASDIITISLVEYRISKQRLTVDATTTAGSTAHLTMQAYDANGNPQGTLQPMPWNATLGLYEVILVGVPQPTTVKVFSDRGGTATSGITRLRTN